VLERFIGGGEKPSAPDSAAAPAPASAPAETTSKAGLDASTTAAFFSDISAICAPRAVWLNSDPWFEVFQHFGRRHARGGATQKPRRFLKSPRASSLRSGQSLEEKTDA